MTKYFSHCCPKMTTLLNKKKAYIQYSPQFKEYYVNTRRQPAILYLMSYCPWCGIQLPKSLRKEWSRTLKLEYKIKNPFDEKEKLLIPHEFTTNEWWITRKL